MENKVYLQRHFKCTITELFNWLVKPELIAQWFGPKNMSVANVKADLRVGGAYSILLQKPNLQSFSIQGEYLEVEKPNCLSFTFQYAELPSPPPNSIVKIKLEKIGDDECRLLFTQTFKTIPPDMTNRTKAWEHMFRVLGEIGGFISTPEN